jgi:hypothetical protein
MRLLAGILIFCLCGCTGKKEQTPSMQTSNSVQKRQLPKPPEGKNTP